MEKLKKMKRKNLCIIIAVLILLLSGLVTLFIFAPDIKCIKIKKNETELFYNALDKKRHQIELDYLYDREPIAFVKKIRENNAKSKDVKFISENKKIASVSKSGVVTAHKSGKTKIRVKSKKYHLNDEIQVNVFGLLRELSLEDITLSVLNPEQKIPVTMNPEDSKPEDFCYELDNPEIAIIENGNIKMNKSGETTLHVSNKKKTIVAQCNVKVLSSPTILHVESVKLLPGETTKVVVTPDIKDTDIGKDYFFKIEDESIASVDEKGNIKALRSGVTNLQVTNDSKLETIVEVRVLTKPSSLSLSNITLFGNDTKKIQVVTDVSNPDTGINFTYKVDNSSIATVDSNGNVKGHKSGKTNLTVTNEYGLSANCTIEVMTYPLTYSDNGVNITITREWFENAWVYAARIKMKDYSRFGTYCANGKYGSTSTVSKASNQLGAILCVNGCYSAPKLGYPVARGGVLYNGGTCWSPAVYSKHNGRLLSAWETGGTPGYAGVDLKTLVNSGKVTDTFTFGPPFLMNGVVKNVNGGGRAQRTFMGTNGSAGDILLCVSDGRKNDGSSAGLTHGQCARYLASKGCTFGIPLDGGGSSEMIFKGRILNAVKSERTYLVDFIYVK